MASHGIVYIVLKDGRIDQLVIPVEGLGMWGTIYGFLALDKDAVTVRGITCPRGSEMVYEEWYDGESNQFRVGCLDPASGETRGRTLLALGVYLGMWFLAIFYLALLFLVIRRAVRAGKLKGIRDIAP